MAFSIIGSIFSAVMMSVGITAALLLSSYEVNLPVVLVSTVICVNVFLFWKNFQRWSEPISRQRWHFTYPFPVADDTVNEHKRMNTTPYPLCSPKIMSHITITVAKMCFVGSNDSFSLRLLQCRSIPNLPPKKCLEGPFDGDFRNKIFRRCDTSRSGMAFTSKYPNFSFIISLFV